jgi:hypothetical protein
MSPARAWLDQPDSQSSSASAENLAIAAPVAFAAGLLALVVGLVFAALGDSERSHPLAFLGTWVAILLSVFAFAFHRIRLVARRRIGGVAAPDTQRALTAFFPNLIAALFLTVALFVISAPDAWLLPVAPLLWALFYGLGLIAIGNFSGRATRALGWFFVAVSVSSFLWLPILASVLTSPGYEGPFPVIRLSHLLMAGLFGPFHLAFAYRVWPRAKPPEGALRKAHV